MDTLEIGRRGLDGEPTSCSHLLVRPGCFVDVAVSFDVVTRKMKRNRNATETFSTRVYLKLLHVFLLVEQDGEVSEFNVFFCRITESLNFCLYVIGVVFLSLHERNSRRSGVFVSHVQSWPRVVSLWLGSCLRR
jgi:hypothetical protein